MKKYIISDPSYIFEGKTLNHFMDSFSNALPFMWQGEKVSAYNTPSGLFKRGSEGYFPVDSGKIAIIPLNICERLNSNTQQGLTLYIADLDALSYEAGVLTIPHSEGVLVINTNESV